MKTDGLLLSEYGKTSCHVKSAGMEYTNDGGGVSAGCRSREDESFDGGKRLASLIDDADLADLLQGFDAVVDIQLFVDVLQMGLDGHRCDIEPCGDFLVAQAFSQKW